MQVCLLCAPMTNTMSSTKSADLGMIAILAIPALLVLIAIAFQVGTTTVSGTPYPAPAAVSQVADPSQGHLFNPDATLDTSQIDDLRDTPDVVAEHLANGDCGTFGTQAPHDPTFDDGCTAVSIDDVGEGVWNALVALGYGGWDDDGTDGADELIYAPVDVVGALQDLEGRA